MRRVLPLLLFGLVALAGVSAADSARLSPLRAVWGKATAVPGLASLATGGYTYEISVSCATPGNCAAGGTYRNDPHVGYHTSAFVVDETNGHWGKAIEIPGLAALNTNDHGHVTSISCPSRGNCVVAGWYGSASGLDAYVAEETNGVWGNAIEVPGTAALNVGAPGEYADAGVDSISCATAGNCAVGGAYTDANGHTQAFVADEANGVWGDAIEVPGTATLNHGGATVASVSCAMPGNCAAGGTYTTDPPYVQHVFVVDETNGSWGTAIQVPGTATRNRGFAEVHSVSCASAGNCAAGGYYGDKRDDAYHEQAFVVDERHGSWGKAINVPGIAALRHGETADVLDVSCATAGNCVAGGTYDRFGGRAFVVAETNGRWRRAIALPGTDVSSVSCPAAGNCSAGGTFLFGEKKGRWSTAIKLRGSGKLRRSRAFTVASLSCAAPDKCTAVGISNVPFVVGSHRSR